MTLPKVSSVTDPGSLVASVAGMEIRLDRVDARLAELRRGPRARHVPPDGLGRSAEIDRWIVQELVTEAVLAHEARVAGLADDVAEDVTSVRLLPSEVARLVAHVTADVAVPEPEIRAYYDRNRDLYAQPGSRRIRQAIVRDRRVAEGIIRDGDVPGERLEIRRGELTGPLEDAIFGAEIGAVVGPIRTELGWHVAWIEAATAAFELPLTEVRAAIEAELLVDARARAFDEWLDGRRRALVTIERGYEHPGHPVHGIPSHRH